MTEAGTNIGSGGSPLRGPLPPERHAYRGGPEERLERLHAYFLEGCTDEIRPVLESVLADARRVRAGYADDEDNEPRARILVASSDPRFLRLARFLLGGRDLEVEELTTPERLPEAILEPTIDLAVLDGADTVADALRTANATRARRPEVPVVIAADTGGKSPSGVRVFDRWNETEELLLDVERLLAEQVSTATPLAAD